MKRVMLRNCHELHVELWDWLSKHPDQAKSDWPRWESNGGDVRRAQYQCFACEAMTFAQRNCCVSRFCPLLWPKSHALNQNGALCSAYDSPFQQWLRARGNDARLTLLAAQIRDLKWRTPARLSKRKAK